MINTYYQSINHWIHHRHIRLKLTISLSIIGTTYSLSKQELTINSNEVVGLVISPLVIRPIISPSEQNVLSIIGSLRIILSYLEELTISSTKFPRHTISFARTVKQQMIQSEVPQAQVFNLLSKSRYQSLWKVQG